MAVTEPKPDENGTETGTLDQTQPVPNVDTALERGKTVPRISDYYTDPKANPARFAKALSASKIRSFDAGDVAEAVRVLEEADPKLVRTAALLGRESDAIRAWVDEAAKVLLERDLPEGDEDIHEPADAVFDGVVRRHIDDFAAKDKQRNVRAQNLLRLTLVWLLQRRNLSPLTALRSIRRIKARKEGTGTDAATRSASKLLRSAKMKLLSDYALIAALSEMTVTQATADRQAALSQAGNLRERVVALETELAAVNNEIAEVNAKNAHLSAELAAIEKALAGARELRALDRTQLVGGFRGFLKGRLIPPLSDARDALGFDPPHVDAANQRIEMAIEAIEREVKESND